MRLEIRTRRMTLRYDRGSEPFGPENLSVKLRGGGKARPSFPPRAWPARRAPVARGEPLHRRPGPGLPLAHQRATSAAGTGPSTSPPVRCRSTTASSRAMAGTCSTTPTPRSCTEDAARFRAASASARAPTRTATCSATAATTPRGLADLRALTGPAPLLPRQAFGVWFSRYFNYAPVGLPADPGALPRRGGAARRADGRHRLQVAARLERLELGPGPLPRPARLLRLGASRGDRVSLNIHPSITARRPALRRGACSAPAARFRPTRRAPAAGRSSRSATSTARGSPAPPPDCSVFDWARAGDQDAYFSLHEPFEREGLDFWWLDYCCDESYAIAPGLTQDTWINQALRRAQRRARQPLAGALAGRRVGLRARRGRASGSGASTATPSTSRATRGRPGRCSTSRRSFSAAEGGVGIPYVSHDIGGFGSITSDGLAGRHLDEELYVRWVQSGAFQPILRLHSDHGDRLPWDYAGRRGGDRDGLPAACAASWSPTSTRSPARPTTRACRSPAGPI